MASLIFLVVALLALAPGFSESVQYETDACEQMKYYKNQLKDEHLTEAQLKEKVVGVLCFLDKEGVIIKNNLVRNIRCLKEGSGMFPGDINAHLEGAHSTTFSPHAHTTTKATTKATTKSHSHYDEDEELEYWHPEMSDYKLIFKDLEKNPSTKCDKDKMEGFLAHCNN